MNASDPGGGSSRIEREVLEILERADAAQTPAENVQAAMRRQNALAQAQVSKTTRRAWRPREWPADILRIGGALLLAIAAAAIADFSRFVAMILAIASAAALFSLWAPAAASGLAGDTPRWRGRDLRDSNGPPDFDIGRIWPRRGPKGPPK